MTTETLTMGDGTLTLTRDGRKLVKVSFLHNDQSNKPQSFFDTLETCRHCGTYLEDDGRGTWRDFGGRFLCKESPSCMHSVYAD